MVSPDEKAWSRVVVEGKMVGKRQDNLEIRGFESTRRLNDLFLACFLRVVERFRYVVSRGFIGRRVVIRLLVFVNYSACVLFGR